MKKVTKRILIISICAVVIGGGALVVLPRLSPKQAAAPVLSQQADAAIPVDAQLPEMGTLEVTTEYIGRIQPDEMVNIIPKMAGTVLATYYNVGDRVNRGDLLFELDPSDLEAQRAQVAAAEAGYKVAKAAADSTLGSQLDLKLLQNDSNIRTARNSYDAARQSLDDYDKSGQLEDLEDAVDSSSLASTMAEREWEAAQAELQAMQNQLATIGYSSGLEAEIKIKKTAVDQYKSTYEQTRTAYEQAKSSYQAARDGNDPQLTQLRNALKSASVSLDTAQQTSQITANKGVPETEASTQAQLEQARASYEASAASYEQQLGYTKITSPIDGVIEQKTVEEHGQATQSQPAYVVSNKDIMVVKFSVPSSAAEQMTVGDPLKIEYGSAVYDGSVIEIGSLVDSASGLFPVKARVDAAQGTLLSGVAVKVTALTAKSEGALIIPVGCLYHDGDITYVYVLSPDGTAVKTIVETGITDDQTVEILSGLDAQSKVITSWNPNLIDGAKVAEAGASESGQEGAAEGGSSSAASGSGSEPDSVSAPDESSSSQEE